MKHFMENSIASGELRKLYLLAFLVVTFAFYGIWIFRILKQKKQSFTAFPKFLNVLLRVIERDMMYPFFVNILAITLGAFFEIALLIGLGLIAITFVITVGHVKRNAMLTFVGKAANVGLTVLMFLDIIATGIDV